MGVSVRWDDPPSLVKSCDLSAITCKEPKHSVRMQTSAALPRAPVLLPPALIAASVRLSSQQSDLQHMISSSLSLRLLAQGRGDLSRQREEARLACQQTERGVDGHVTHIQQHSSSHRNTADASRCWTGNTEGVNVPPTFFTTLTSLQPDNSQQNRADGSCYKYARKGCWESEFYMCALTWGARPSRVRHKAALVVDSGLNGNSNSRRLQEGWEIKSCAVRSDSLHKLSVWSPSVQSCLQS